MTTLTAVVTIPMATRIASVTPAFVHGLFGKEWSATVPVIQMLAIFGLIRSISAVDGSTDRAFGRPDVSTKIHVSALKLMVIAIYPIGNKFGFIRTSIDISISLMIASKVPI